MLLKTVNQTLDQKVWEFDFWVTPSIVDIRATDRFKLEMRRITAVLEALSNGGHRDIDSARYAAELVDRSVAYLDAFPHRDAVQEYIQYAEEFLVSLSALLFLVTGKSDNNNKCQFPIYLRNQAGWETIQSLRTKKGKQYVVGEVVPRVLDSESYMARIAKMHVADRQNSSDASLRNASSILLFQFVNFLLADEPSKNQLTAYLMHFSKAKAANEDSTVLLTPLVMFQVRGSVAASGGHEPEEILRVRMSDWGMVREIDFNSNDVILDIEAGVIFEMRGDLQEEKQGKTKTRAYDFVLPFRTPSWHPMIFVQSQFYAGDSGSVSHKNVDQTKTSRQNATQLSSKAWPTKPQPVFLEYVDGAGYSASLNGDLKSLLSFDDTAGFFQVRSASIRLRRELQKIGFLTPLEIGHASLCHSCDSAKVVSQLVGDGYSQSEIERAIEAARNQGLIGVADGNLTVSDAFMPIVRQHLLLDIIACEGSAYQTLVGITGVALVPGYGPYHGLSVADLEAVVRSLYKAIWPEGFMSDLQQLCAAGLVVLR